MSKRTTTEEFIKMAKSIESHKDKGYDYSKVNYINRAEKVCIICPKHGEFWQIAGNHLMGHGCPKCRVEKIKKIMSSNTNKFIEKAKKVEAHKGKNFDYSKVKYVNNHTKVCIICPKHGEFWQNPSSHLNGHGCPECAKEAIWEKVLSKFAKKK